MAVDVKMAVFRMSPVGCWLPEFRIFGSVKFHAMSHRLEIEAAVQNDGAKPQCKQLAWSDAVHPFSAHVRSVDL